MALTDRLNAALERYLPEKRLFLRSDQETRFVRLKPLSQATILGGAGLVLAWTLVASAILLMDMTGTGDRRAAAMREQSYFETRLGELAAERDRALVETQQTQARYASAMEQVAQMQGQILLAEQRRAELETAFGALQTTLRARQQERDAAQSRLAALETGDGADELVRASARLTELEGTLDQLMAALSETAEGREAAAFVADEATRQAQHLALEYRLIQDRNTRIFSQLEQAISESMVPLQGMFRNIGISPDTLLNQVRAGQQTRSAALTPISISTSGTLDPDADEARANSVLSALEQVDLYRIAAQRTPFALPVSAGTVRHTSGFGMRRDPRTGASRMHSGVDWAGPQGTAIRATAGGVVTHAGRQGGYGNLVIVQHDFGIETYYAHLHRIDVNVGQRVSRGDRIGGMGTTGRSTGVHLHYEIRVGGRAINPMTYIRAAQNVF